MLYTLLFMTALVTPYNSYTWLDSYRAQRNYDRGDLEQAGKSWEECIIAQPKNTTALYNRGVTAFKSGDFETSQTYFLHALSDTALAPQQRETILYNLGNVSAQLKQYKQACDYFEQVLKLNPDNEKAHKKLLALQQLLEEQSKNNSKQKESDKSNNTKDVDNSSQPMNSNKQQDQHTDSPQSTNNDQKDLNSQKNSDQQKENSQSEENNTQENHTDEQQSPIEKNNNDTKDAKTSSQPSEPDQPQQQHQDVSHNIEKNDILENKDQKSKSQKINALQKEQCDQESQKKPIEQEVLTSQEKQLVEHANNIDTSCNKVFLQRRLTQKRSHAPNKYTW
jgi:tetratricopeptide (TPR) repeat protein